MASQSTCHPESAAADEGSAVALCQPVQNVGAPFFAQLYRAKGGIRQRSYAFVAVALLLASPLVLRAQFQPVSPDELKMTSDPKAPKAAAVYLDREEITENNVETIYARIKVLTEKGEELATVRVPFEAGYSTLKLIEGRTTHPDGTVYPLTVKPEDLLDVKTKYFQKDTIVFTLPSVEVGSVLEYRIQTLPNYTPQPSWELQLPYFIHKEHFSFKQSYINGILYGRHGKTLDRLVYICTPHDVPVQVAQNKGRFTADASDVPPLPDEDWMPPINTFRWRAEFFYTYARTSKEFWDTELKFWNQDTEDFIHLSGTIKKAAASLVSETDTEEQKARKIYIAVMKLDNTDFSRVKSEAERKKDKLKEINSVDDVWKNQSGPGNSIALLYVALARAAGLKVWPMQVVDRQLAIFDPNYLSVSQLDDYIAIVNIGGKEVYVDPAQKGCPFGGLHWVHSLAGGFRESEAGPVIAGTPASGFKTNAAERVADLTLDAQGNVTGSARIVLSGAEALYWRQLALQNDPEEMKKKFNESLEDELPEGVHTEFDHFLGMDDYEQNLIATVNVNGKLGTATGKHFFLPGFLFASRAQHPFVAVAKRTIPIDVHYPRQEKEDIVYHLPTGYSVESAPARTSVSWPGSALLNIGSGVQNGSVEVARAFAWNFTLLAPGDYDNLHDFYIKVATADQQQIVLKRTDSAKGN